MIRTTLCALASLSLVTGAPALAAKPCKDANGRFSKCPQAVSAKAVRCKAASGKFAKCGTPGAKPI